MSILDTFYILFETDAKQAAADVRSVDQASKETEAGLQKLDEAINTTNTQLDEAGATAVDLGASLETARKKLDEAGDTAATTGAALDRLDRETDGAVDGLQAIDKATDAATEGLGKTGEAAETTGASFVRMAKSIAAPIAAMISFGALAASVVGRLSEVRELDQFSSKLNSAVSDVDAFRRAVTATGGESAAALDSLVKLGEQVNDAFTGGGARENFEKWGLAFTDAKGAALGASDAMLELAGNLEGVSRAEALDRIKKLGIEDAATIDLLLKGRAALEAKMRAEKELGVVTEEQARLTRTYYTEVGRLRNTWEGFRNTVIAAVLPALTRLMSGLAGVAGWMGQHRGLVTGFFAAVAGVLTAVYTPAIIRAAAATWAMIGPYALLALAVVAVGAAFALAWEDVQAFLNGQPSLIGTLAGKYEWVRTILEGIGDAWGLVTRGAETAKQAWNAYAEWALEHLRPVGEMLGSLWDLITSVADLLKDVGVVAWGLLRAAGEAALGALIDKFPGLGGAIDAAGAKIRDVFGAAFGWLEDAWGRLIANIKLALDGITAGVRWVDRQVERLGSWVGVGGEDPAPPAPSTEGGSAPPAPSTEVEEHGALAPPVRAAPSMSLAEAQRTLSDATMAPINGVTSAMTAGPTTVNRTVNVEVGEVNVNADGVKADEVAGIAAAQLTRELRKTAAQLDDGVTS